MFFYAFESLRGICAIIVAIFHFKNGHSLEDVAIIKYGELFVDFFFVLSGFVIFYCYLDKIGSSVTIHNFMFKRFMRLYPIHLATLMMFIASEIVSSAPFERDKYQVEYIWQHLMLVHSFMSNPVDSFNVPSWSISAEFYTYLLFAFLIVHYRKNIALINLALIIVVFAYLASTYYMRTTDLGILRCIYGFAVGGLIFMAWNKYKIKMRYRYWCLGEITTFSLVLAFVTYAKYLNIQVLAPLVMGAFLFFIAYQKGIISQLLTNLVCYILGRISFSIYLVHPIVIPLVKKGFATEPPDFALFVYLLTVLVLSAATYTFIEKPFRSLGNRIARKKSFFLYA